MIKSALVAVLLAGCTSWPEPRDPLDPMRSDDIGLPVLGYQWERTIFDQSWVQLPQEFAGVTIQHTAVGSVLYIGSHGGLLWALDAADGTVLWKTKVGPTSCQPLVDGDTIYLGTDAGYMIAIDAIDGKERWRYATKGEVLHPPALVDDGKGRRLVVFSNDVDHVHALDAKTGTSVWLYERETPEDNVLRGHAGVTAVGDKIFSGFADGHVVALAVRTGEVIWVRSLAGESTRFLDVDTTPVVKDGILYAASATGGLYALDAADGSEKWRAPIDNASQVTVDGGRLYVAAADTGLHVLDLGGHVLWRQGLSHAGDPARPVIDGDYLFLSLSDAGMFVVDKRNGHLLQNFDPGHGVSSAPTIDGDRLYVMSNGGILYSLDVRTFPDRS
jgi:outer membrane protein assembly factor BamB